MKIIENDNISIEGAHTMSKGKNHRLHYPKPHVLNCSADSPTLGFGFCLISHSCLSLSRACKYSLLFFILRWLDNMTNFLHPVSDEQRSNTERSRRKSTEFMFRNAQWHAALASGKNTLGFSEYFSVESNWRVVSGNPQKKWMREAWRWHAHEMCTRLANSHRFSIFLTLVRVEIPPRAALTHRCLLGNAWISQNNTWFPVWLFPKRKNNTQNSATEHTTAGNSIYV